MKREERRGVGVARSVWRRRSGRKRTGGRRRKD